MGVLTVACRPPGELVIRSAVRNRPESDLKLFASDAHFARDVDDGSRVLIQCPLPGSHRGKPFGTVYLRLPAAEGRFRIGHGAADAHGFLIQHFGSMAGMVRFASGTVTLDRAALGGSKVRAGRLALRGADGVTVDGTFTARRSKRALSRFEDLFAADIERLTSVASTAKAAKPSPVSSR